MISSNQAATYLFIINQYYAVIGLWRSAVAPFKIIIISLHSSPLLDSGLSNRTIHFTRSLSTLSLLLTPCKDRSSNLPEAPCEILVYNFTQLDESRPQHSWETVLADYDESNSLVKTHQKTSTNNTMSWPKISRQWFYTYPNNLPKYS